MVSVSDVVLGLFMLIVSGIIVGSLVFAATIAIGDLASHFDQLENWRVFLLMAVVGAAIIMATSFVVGFLERG